MATLKFSYKNLDSSLSISKTLTSLVKSHLFLLSESYHLPFEILTLFASSKFDQHPEDSSLSERTNQHDNVEEKEVNSRELVIFDKGASEESETESNTFTLLLQLKHRNSPNFVGMGQKSSESVAVGCKVLPICDAASLGSRTSTDIGREGPDKDVQKRRKAVSRMKELIRWAAAVKNSKAAGIKGWKVLYFKNKMTLKNSLDDDEITSSSKISFAWDAGSCSTSSVFSPLSLPLVSRLDHQMSAKNTHSSAVALQSSNSNASTLTTLGFSLGRPETEGCSRGGQWITSDSDFVVLEL